jgi:hypothetical protein
MKEVDLSGIDPLRRDEVRRRIGILQRYLALKSPTKADAEHFTGWRRFGESRASPKLLAPAPVAGRVRAPREEGAHPLPDEVSIPS